jgi:two-component sensor histidine kinase
MLVLDRWVENLRCPICRKTGTARLSQTDGWSVHIEVEAEALEIDPARAVTFGLLVNELATNAIKHAFPEGTGRIVLGVKQIGDQIELTVADNGVGMKDKYSAQISERHGSDYVAIFVRQIGGTIAVSRAEGAGTVVRIRLPLLVAAHLKGLSA